jgi:hypothetical protein
MSLISRFNLGDGVDTLSDSGISDFDTLVFGEDITSDMISLGRGSLLIRSGVRLSRPGLYGHFSRGQRGLSFFASRFIPGMLVNAEIHLGTRSVLEYLLSPVQKVVHEAGRER